MAKTILVVDDMPESRELLETILTRADFSVITANNAFEGLALLENRTVDGIILDVMMPDRTGIEMLENLRWEPRFSNIPVICISAAHVRGEALQFIQEFSMGFVDKANISEVVTLLNDILIEE